LELGEKASECALESLNEASGVVCGQARLGVEFDVPVDESHELVHSFASSRPY
jgi:hypothetical protein